MKSVFLISALILMLSATSRATPPKGYRLKWSDEFNSDILNTDYWNIETGARNSAVNTAAAVSTTNGDLVLTTYSKNGTNYAGFIDTKGKVLNKYGYYEARIRFRNAPGTWSAFWLESPFIHCTNSLNDPTNGVEIDIFEHRMIDRKHRNWTNGGDQALHWNGYVKGLHQKNIYFNKNLGVGSGFHNYGLLWRTDGYSFFVDGHLTWKTNYLVSSVKEYVLFSSEVKSNSWAGDVPKHGYPDFAHSKVKMFVDYVRYYAPSD